VRVRPFIFLSFLIFSLSLQNVSADSVTGYDLLALQHPTFPTQKILAEIPNGSALGVLLDTFGDDRSRISEALNSGKFSYFRIHLANGPGLRNKQLGDYENLAGLNVRSFQKKILSDDKELLASFVERAKFVNDLANQFPKIKCFISPVLEHNLSAEAFSKLAALVHETAPTCLIVDNPVNGWSYQLQNDQILEVHGTENPPSGQYIASQDGDFGETKNFLDLHNKAFIKFIWKGGYNCRAPGKFIDPRQRTECGS
jgi:hypothetical protein